MIFALYVVMALAVLYFYLTKDYDYWSVRGIKFIKPIPIFGNAFKNLCKYCSITQLFTECYWAFPNEKAVGIFYTTKPLLIVRDPEIVKRVLITDFGSLYTRGVVVQNESLEPLLRNLFTADGDLWRLLRQRMTPAFTSGKLKSMFPLITERAVALQKRLRDNAAAGHTLDARDLLARFSTDFIGACGFGIDSDSLNDEDSAFRKLGEKIFIMGYREYLNVFLKNFFPGWFQHLKIFGKVEDEIVALVKSILKQRNYEPSGRGDFIDLLLECKKKGTIVGESLEKRNPDGSPEIVSVEFDDMLMAAQVFIFFAAGFETSSSSSSSALHLLAFHPEEQKKVQKEIVTVLAKYDNKLTFDSVKEMTYLECAYKEAARIMPSVGYVTRDSSRELEIPELGITIDAGVRVIVPVQALQNDPKYWDNPEEYRPERFKPENIEEKTKYAFMPFGLGPRACIGGRLGLMQSLSGLAAVLSRFTVRPAPETLRHPEIDPQGNVIQMVKNGLPLIFEERKDGVILM